MTNNFTTNLDDEKILVTDAPEEQRYVTKTRIGKRRGYGLTILAAVMLVNANMNIIDILPDLVPYLILSSIIGNARYMVPYLAECKSALNKLALISAIKLPALFVMSGNMSSGRDIIPLFTLAFSILELIYLYSAISNGFSALFYLGQRRDKTEGLIKPFAFLGKKIRPDDLRILAYIFFTAKAVLALLPELCNLTSGNDRLMHKLRSFYPIALIICIGLVTLMGILMLTLTVAYLRHLRRTTDLRQGIFEFAGDDRLRAIDNNAKMRGYLETITVLLFSSLLSFDIQLDSYGDVLILPHFLYGILLVYVAFRLPANGLDRKAAVCISSLYTLTAAVSYYLNISFHDNYDLRDLQVNQRARDAYRLFEISSVIECILYIGICVSLCYSLIYFIRRHTLTKTALDNQSRQTRAYLKSTKIRSIALFTVGGVASIAKLIKVISDGKVEMIITGADVVTSSSLPWLGLVCTALSFLFFAISWYFLSSVKEDIEIRYKDESYSF